MAGQLERICLERDMRMSGLHRVILHILDEARDHPCADEIRRRVRLTDPRISLATIYRTLNILAEAGVLSRVEFGDGKTRYEEAGAAHHEHLIDVETCKVIEFCDDAIEALLHSAASRLGYHLVQYKLRSSARLRLALSVARRISPKRLSKFAQPAYPSASLLAWSRFPLELTGALPRKRVVSLQNGSAKAVAGP